MNLELKKQIFLFMCDHQNEFQLVNFTVSEFRPYIYTPEGNFLIGGETVYEFISTIYETIFKN
jgi:hypothetical protein